MMKTSKLISREVLAAASFLILVPLIAHLSFSWIGFTPTDEGFTLANSRRILDGQVPHRDFILIRPFVSPLIHVPFVLFGDNTFWLSRLFVWFQLASISWLWVSIINRMMKFPFSVANKVLISLICFAASVHTKHITAWNTIDGLFFIAIGLALAIRNRPAAKLIGYFLIGLSPLCKQSFVFIPLLSLIILGDWRQVKCWVAAASPALCCLVFLALTHALSDAFVQLTSRTELVSVGLLPYTGKRLMLSVVVGYLSFWLGLGRSSSMPDQVKKRIAISMIYFAPLLGTAASLWFDILMDTSFLLFGFLLGATIYLLTHNSSPQKAKHVSLLVLLTAWSASLSGGYNSPALVSGPILVALIAHVFSRYKQNNKLFLQYSLPIASALILYSFGVARTRYIYRDKAAGQLTYPLEGVLRGGKHIYTNSNTYEFMYDLKRAVELAENENKEYTILPNVAAYWVESAEENPLPIVWPDEADELKQPAVMKRFIEAMETNRNSTIFIVQKVSAASLAKGFLPLEDSEYHNVVGYVRTHFTKFQETSFFELYR